MELKYVYTTMLLGHIPLPRVLSYDCLGYKSPSYSSLVVDQRQGTEKAGAMLALAYPCTGKTST
jgi:hypothetical protein